MTKRLHTQTEHIMVKVRKAWLCVVRQSAAPALIEGFWKCGKNDEPCVGAEEADSISLLPDEERGTGDKRAAPKPPETDRHPQMDFDPYASVSRLNNCFSTQRSMRKQYKAEIEGYAGAPHITQC